MTPEEKLKARIDTIRHGGVQLVSHLNMTDQYGRCDQSIAEPRIRRFSGGPKGRGTKRHPRIAVYCYFKIASGDDAYDLVEYPTVDAAVTALDKADREREARAWEAAAPAPAEA